MLVKDAVSISKVELYRRCEYDGIDEVLPALRGNLVS
jgi:hypothetical protein